MSITNVNVSTDPYPTPSEIQAEIDSLLVELKTHPSSTILLAEIMYVMQEYGAGIVYTQSNSISEMNKYIGQIKDVWNSIDAANNSSTAGTGVNTTAYQAKLENIVTEVQNDPFFNTPQGSAMKTQILGTIANLQSLVGSGDGTVPSSDATNIYDVDLSYFCDNKQYDTTFDPTFIKDVNNVINIQEHAFGPYCLPTHADVIALQTALNTLQTYANAPSNSDPSETNAQAGANALWEPTSYGNFESSMTDIGGYATAAFNDSSTLHDLWVQYNGSTGAQGDTTAMSQLMRQMGQLNQQFTGASQILSAEVGVSTKTYQSEQSLFNNFLKMLSNLMKVMIQGQKTQ